MSVSTHISESLKQDITKSIEESIDLDDDVLDALSSSILLNLQKKLGGTSIYIPVVKTERDIEEIKKLFTGRNHAEVCKKYNISLSTFYRIIN